MSQACCQRCGQSLLESGPSILCGLCALPSWPTDATLQRHLPDIKVTDLVDGSSFEAVYQAHQTTLQRPVSLTLAHPTPDTSIHHYRDRCRQWACLHHPFIPSVHDYGVFEGFPYVVSEPLPLIHLSDALHDQEWAPHASQRLLIELCEALRHAHENGVIHGALEAECVLLDNDGHPAVSAWLTRPMQTIGGDPQVDMMALRSIGRALCELSDGSAMAWTRTVCAKDYATVTDLLCALTTPQEKGSRTWFGKRSF